MIFGTGLSFDVLATTDKKIVVIARQLYFNALTDIGQMHTLMYTLPWWLTWHRPFPGGSSRTRVYLGSWGKPARCPQWAAGRLSSPPPTGHTARTGHRGDRGRSPSTSQLRTHRGCSSVQWLLFLGHLLWRWSSRCIRPGSSVLAASPSSAESDSQRETRWQRATSSRLKKGGIIMAEDKWNGSIYVLMTFLHVLPLGLMHYFIAVAVITN